MTRERCQRSWARAVSASVYCWPWCATDRIVANATHEEEKLLWRSLFKQSCCRLKRPSGSRLLDSGAGLRAGGRSTGLPGPTARSGRPHHVDETDRTHLDLWVDRATSDSKSEVERLIALGATRVE
jgi:hypothetical protein